MKSHSGSKALVLPYNLQIKSEVSGCLMAGDDNGWDTASSTEWPSLREDDGQMAVGQHWFFRPPFGVTPTQREEDTEPLRGFREPYKELVLLQDSLSHQGAAQVREKPRQAPNTPSPAVCFSSRRHLSPSLTDSQSHLAVDPSSVWWRCLCLHLEDLWGEGSRASFPHHPQDKVHWALCISTGQDSGSWSGRGGWLPLDPC